MSVESKLAPATLPLTVGESATLACIWEATAPKPGNVYRGADFEDLSYVDFLTSAIVIGPIIQQVDELGVGNIIKQCAIATRNAVNTNTNLGILLLLGPMAKVPKDTALDAGVPQELAALDAVDTELVYQAIQIASPGGMGNVEQADVHSAEVPDLPLNEVMQMAADRDMIAKQYTNGFQQVFWMADLIEACLDEDLPMSGAIVMSYLEFLGKFPDSLVARKCGEDFSREVSARSRSVLHSGHPESLEFQQAVADFDFWLRTDGHQRNPGTTADFVAAGLYVLLRERRLKWPVQFYRDDH